MFVHLHTHSEYSLLDGYAKIRPLVQRCRDLGMPALALTDHGALYGAIEFYRECQEAGVKPLIGCEVYLALGSRHDRSPAEKSPFHLTVLARDSTGYQNLVRLVTAAHLEGFYYKPRIDRELLARHSQGLTVLSGCLNAEIPRLILEGREEEARRAAGWFREVFGPHFYLELQRHLGAPELETVNRSLLALHREMDIPLVATNDAHYIVPEDAPFQDVLICIHTNATLQEEKRLKMTGDSFYLKSPQEMADLFPDLPEALANTLRIAEECDLELDFGHLRLPRFPVPTGEDADAYLSRLCWEGLERRRPGAPERYRQRLAYELEVIRQTRFADYFLVVWDIAHFARSRGILCGVRGSGAASLALYCLGVTDVDPLEYGLVFERFLNIERREMPDIDMDFQDDRRDEVLNYVVERYGRDRVAQIITFGTMGPKAAVRDVGRVLGLSYPDVDRVARLVPPRAKTLDEALETSPPLRDLYQADPTYRNLLDTARRLEGLVHHVSTHAAGVVIAPEPLEGLVPLQRPVRGGEGLLAMTQYDMESIALLGLLKMDFLGLANFTILHRAMDLVEKTRSLRLSLDQIPLDDPRTFDLLSSGETTDIFQLEGPGMRRTIRELKPSSLRDIAAVIALYRPGPMEHLDTYIRAKNGQERVRYPHPSLKGILEETYGVIVYQEQVLFIVQEVAGYSLGEADIVRKAMGKKVPEIMQKERERFIQGARQRGYTQEEAETLFHLIEPFAGYAFNKAHSVSYALVAYWTAYFKANFPHEYMTAVLNTRMGNLEKTAAAVRECQRLGIPVLPPDVNRSAVGFAIEEVEGGQRAIRFGLAAVKNVGETAVVPIVEARRAGGPFKSLEDLFRRADLRGLNRRTLESLVKVGAFDSLHPDRSALLAGLDRLLALAHREARLRQRGQTTLFDLMEGEAEAPFPALELPRGSPLSPRERAAWERELLGVALGENPLAALASSLGETDAVLSIHDIDPEEGEQFLTLLGQVASVRPGQTRDKRPYLAALLALQDGTVEVVAWPEVYERTRDLWQEGNILWVRGRLQVREDGFSLRCADARLYTPPPPSAPEPSPARPEEVRLEGEPSALVLTLQETSDPQADEERLREVLRLLLEFPGPHPVSLFIRSGRKRVRLQVPSLTVSISSPLLERLQGLLGSGAVHTERGEGPSAPSP